MTHPFGVELKSWRSVRGMSQLDLASHADVSQRHISFLETGRSNPSREMVLHLGRVLDVPPREQNLLLRAAGHAAAFSETPLDEMPDVSGVLTFILRAHEPNMAIVVDRRWDVVAANAPAARFTAALFADAPDWLVPPPNIMRLSFHPDGLRRYMEGWDRTAAALLRRLERDVASYPHDQGLRHVLDEVHGFPGVSELPTGRRQAQAGDLMVPTTYLIDGDRISLFTTIAVIGDAHDCTLAELRIETFWPVDDASRTRWERHFGPDA